MNTLDLINCKVSNHEGYAALPLTRVYHTEAEVVANWNKRVDLDKVDEPEQMVRVTWTEVLPEVLP